MDGRFPRPKLMFGVRNRKFSRYENFKQFDHLSSGSASAGSASIGKVRVDCEFLFRKSKWGVLSDEQFPAGIIYLNLNFGPPQGCIVKSATVTVTLDEQDPSLGPYKAGRVLHASGCPVQITDWYGPRQLAGVEKSANIRQTTKMMPEVNALGNGGGGLGVQSDKSFTHTARWAFNGQLLPGKGTWTYTTLRWDLKENELEKQQSFHSNRVHTAFAFEHAGQPFLMTVKIEGKLEKLHDRILSKMKFGASKDNNNSNTTTTLVDFGQHQRFQQQLDEIARGLARAMEMENFEEVPVELPGPVAPSFAPAPTEPSGATRPQETLTSSMDPASLVSSAPPRVEGPRRQRTIEAATNDATAPTIENFRRVLDALSHPVQEEDAIAREDVAAETSSGTAATLVGEEDAEVFVGKEEKEEPASAGDIRNAHPQLAVVTQEMDMETIMRILMIPGVLVILKLFSGLVGLVRSPSGTEKYGLAAATGRRSSSAPFSEPEASTTGSQASAAQ